MSTTYPSTPDPAVRIAVIGDVHERWDAVDVSTIDALGYQLVLFTGDLADRMHRRTLDVARRIAPLATPAVLIPGNHDATTPLGVLAEALGRLRTRPGQAGRHAKRLRALRDALGPVSVGGYSLHPVPPVGATDPAITVIAARPHAMDGRRVTFPHAVGVADLDASAARLRALVDAAPGALVFVAHNGPNGLGADRAAPFALRRGRRDLGDPDLADAVGYARDRGRTVLAVVAGHLHHRGANRRWQVERDGVLYVNAARVPRIRVDRGRTVRHHVELRIADGRAAARAVWIP